MKKKPQRFFDEEHPEKVFFDGSLVSAKFVYHVWFVIGAIVITGTALYALWQGTDVILLVFGGVLLGMFFSGIAGWISDKTGISKSWSVGIVLLLISGLIILGLWFLYPSLKTQFEQLNRQLPQAVENLRQQLSQTTIGQRIVERIPTMDEIGGKSSNLFGKLTGYFSSVLNAFVSFIVIVVVGIYFAFSPRVYYNGFLKLIPDGRQNRIREVLDTLGYTLRWWLVGRLSVMTINGIITAVGLWLLGIPLAIPLGILTGLLNFIPNIGPVLAAAPAILLALMQSPTTALYVALFYLALQGLEGYVLTPLVQQKIIALPAILIITFQLLLGVLLGFLGVLFAVPVLAVIFIVVKMLYVEDVLEHEVEIKGEKKIKEDADTNFGGESVESRA